MQYWSDLKPSLSCLQLNLPSRSKTRKWTKSDGGSEGLLLFQLDHISELVCATQEYSWSLLLNKGGPFSQNTILNGIF